MQGRNWKGCDGVLNSKFHKVCEDDSVTSVVIVIDS